MSIWGSWWKSAPGRPIARRVGRRHTHGQGTAFLAQVLQLPAPTADEVLEACFGQMADTRVVLATAATLAGGLPIDRALAWSARMREAGFTTKCPLVAIATGDAAPPIRARAAATVVPGLRRSPGSPSLHGGIRRARPLERETIRGEARALCPELLAEAETATPSRRLPPTTSVPPG